MDQSLVLLILFWAMSGALIGGVVTPILAANKRVNEWLAALLGTIAGAVGNLVALVPLWLVLSRRPDVADERLPWQRDAAPFEPEAEVETGPRPSPLEMLRANFWPASRPVHEHSHRMTYIGVFVALAIITAVEVALTYIDVPFSIVGPLVALSTAKVLLVVMFFMHLRFDSKLYAAVFLFAVPFAAMALIVLSL
ncbi:MAG: cytochrome C oxidase subunit IV family protein [Chloroflexi bacterium]|jgi:caa(3)-type oxidase subunit IV|nr:cytochrome C oxidase subunit IV family protein [Chloroflexota bacterium]